MNSHRIVTTMKILGIYITFVIFTFSTSYGQATNSEASTLVRIGLNPVIGTKADVNDDLTMSEGFGMAVRSDISISRRFSVVPEFIYYFPTPINTNGFGGVDFTIWQFNVNSNFFIEKNPVYPISAYLIGGLSYNYADAERRISEFDVFENVDDLGANFGVGLTGRRRILAAEVKYDTAFDQITFSAVIYFGAYN